MGKFASTTKNIIGIIGLFLLAHLGYKLYIITEKLSIMCIEINEMNGLMRNLYEVMRAIAKRYRIEIP